MIKIAITGPESTGKSWLAEHLAQHYNTVWVPEIARDYLQDRNGQYNLDDVIAIAKMQLLKENSLLSQANRILFSDTEMLVCVIWTKVVFNNVPESIQNAFEDQYFDHYLLCDIDLPWEPDPLREHPDRRSEIFKRYADALTDAGRSFTVVSGFGRDRLNSAVNAIETRVSL